MPSFTRCMSWRMSLSGRTSPKLPTRGGVDCLHTRKRRVLRAEIDIIVLELGGPVPKEGVLGTMPAASRYAAPFR